ncbi:MAG: PKD domain-containing protein, partial [Anaerolineae bacterium]|nr:PKD domain-containing protein [Anaerolineae bacterium]
LHVREDGARLDRISLELISGSGNLMPIANAGSYPNPIQDSDGLVGETVQLNGTGSSDVDGTIASYAWTVNGTDNYTGAQPTVTLNDGANTVQLIVTDNEGADSTPVQITVNVEPPAVCGSLIQEAEFGDRSGSFVIGNDVAASGGQYVHRPNGAGDSFTAPGNSNVSFCFNVTQAGIYQIKGWVYAAGDSDDSFWVTVNGASYLWDTFVNQTYAEDYVNNRGGADPVQINLNAGDVTVTVHLRESGTLLDRIQLELITPTGNTPPVADAGADITVSDTDGLAGETLQLDGSASTDADGTIVSYAWTVNGTDNYTGAQPTVDLNDGQNTINLVVTDDGGAQASDTQIITVDAPNVDPVVVTGFFLVDAFTDTDFQPLLDNASLDINALPAGANIRVEISGTISDVVITLTGAVNQSVTESTAPYSLFGDTNGDFAAWTPVLGDYVLEAVPHLPGGAEGTSLTINFSIVDGGVGENLPPTADAGEDFTVQDTDSLPGESNVQLDGSGSSDPESGGLAYLWTVNGTDTYTGVQPLVDLADGQNSITLVVTDGQGASSGPDTVNVTVVAPVVGTPVINGLVLVDGGNNTDFGALQNFDVLQLVSRPSTLNIRADVNSDTARVTFSLTGDVTQNLNDGSAPFLAFAEFAPWTPIA